MKNTLLAAALAIAATCALAQPYPSRPVKLVVPFPAGSATDQVARVLGQELQEALKQPAAALESYQRYLKDVPGSSRADEVRGRIAQLGAAA